MLCLFRITAPGLVVAALATPLSAEHTPGPPDWQDGGASVYLREYSQVKALEHPIAQHAPDTGESPATVHAAAHATQRFDSGAVSPSQETPAAETADSDRRRLAPPSDGRQFGGSRLAVDEPVKSRTESSRSKRATDFGLPLGSISTLLSALVIVIGALLIFVWVLRRSGGRTTTGLPAEVVSVLGRVPLAARQVAQLLRVGNKLVLVSLTPAGAETLTEVTDPVEVDRLVGLCQQFNPHSTTKAFEQIFRQFSREPRPDGFADAGSLPTSFASAADYHNPRGDVTRG